MEVERAGPAVRGRPLEEKLKETDLMLKAICVLVLLPVVAWGQAGTAVVKSPDGRLAMAFRTVGDSGQAAEAGRLVYSVTVGGKALLTDSGLRLDLKGQEPLGTHVRIAATAPGRIDQTWKPVVGKTSSVHDRCNTLRLSLEETGGSGRKLAIEARAYDDAVAFRYVVPEQAGLKEFLLAREQTEFRISKDPICYALMLPNYRSMYESEFLKLSATSLSNQGGVKSTVLLGLPLLMHVPGVAWAAISEADLQRYSSMYLENPSGNWAGHWFVSMLAPRVDDPELAVSGALPHQSAWRVVLIGDEPGRLIESNVINSLNPPCAIADTSWIHAGKASWNWWSGSIGADGKSAFTTDTIKYYVDFAARSGFEYMLIDAGWSARRDITRMNGRVDVPAVVAYAKAKGVKVWIWLGYGDTRRQMDEAFAVYEKWGVAGVKIDFIERDDQAGMAFYYRVAETAAKHHLMVDFHGCTKPTGIERTWPNVLGYEAVLGMEQSKAGSRDNPDHHVMIPFTRMLAGPMDYTPGGFNNVTQAAFEARHDRPMVTGTRAHHLAMYVVYEAGFQMVSDDPQTCENQAGFEFVKQAPATWDQTRVLGGMPGEFITIARRSGDAWYVGSMTNWEAREVAVPLAFLGEGKYTAEIYADAADAGENPTHLSVEKKQVDRTMTLKVRLAPGGGAAIRLAPVQ